MTSISALSSPSYQSPLQKLQDELQSEVNSGAISSSDQSALSSALNDIDSSLQSGQADASSGSTNSSPGDLKSKIDSLIANEVSSGKLTSDQATELQGVFKQAFAQGPGAAGAPWWYRRCRRYRQHRACASWPSRRSAARRRRLLHDRRHQQHQLRQRHPAAVPAGAAELAVRCVVVILRRKRRFRPRQQQFVVLGAADQLPELTSNWRGPESDVPDLLERARLIAFSATVHLMIGRVDAGPIIEVKLRGRSSRSRSRSAAATWYCSASRHRLSGTRTPSRPSAGAPP